MFTYSHGCSQTGHFKLTNLSIDTQSRIPFNEVLTNCSSKLIEDDLHFVVNIDDTAVSPGQYSYGKWTVKHYSKEYEGVVECIMRSDVKLDDADGGVNFF